MLVDQFRFQCHRFMSSGALNRLDSADHAEPIVDGMVSEPGVQVGGLADVDHLVFEIENLVHVEVDFRTSDVAG